MRLKFYSKDGCKVEHEKKAYMLYEFSDGMHYAGPQSVYRDRDGKDKNEVVFFEGRVTALGTSQKSDELDRIWSNIDLTKEDHSKVGMSNSLMRWIQELMEKSGKYIPVIIIVLVVVFAIASNGWKP